MRFFTPVEAVRYIMMLECKIFLANSSFIGEIVAELLIYTCWYHQFIIVAYATLKYSKSCMTHKHNMRFDCKFRNKVVLCIPTELSQKYHDHWSTCMVAFCLPSITFLQSWVTSVKSPSVYCIACICSSTMKQYFLYIHITQSCLHALFSGFILLV